MIVRTLREDRGWSQEQLAQTSGVSVRTIQRIETGGRASLETLKCFAAGFETTIPELKKDADMTDHDKPIESVEPAPKPPLEDTPGLSDDDRAALRYARNLRKYDKAFDVEFSLGADDDDIPNDPNLSPDENRILRQVRRVIWGMTGNAIRWKNACGICRGVRGGGRLRPSWQSSTMLQWSFCGYKANDVNALGRYSKG